MLHVQMPAAVPSHARVIYKVAHGMSAVEQRAKKRKRRQQRGRASVVSACCLRDICRESASEGSSNSTPTKLQHATKKPKRLNQALHTSPEVNKRRKHVINA